MQKKKASDRRAEILESARHLLISEGSRALTLRGVANAVGLKLASIQYYFPTHAELIDALVADRLEEQQTEIERLQAQTDGSSAEVLDAVLRWFTFGQNNTSGDDRLDVQLWALAQVDDSARRALARYHDQYVAFLAKLIREGVGVSKQQSVGRAVAIASLLEGSILFVELAADIAPGKKRYKDIYNSVCLIAYGAM
ncbi:MAG: TetR family transcriptional regulator [Pseudomonadota bacterium]